VGDGITINTFPTKKVTVPVDVALVRSNGTVNQDDSVVSQLSFEIPRTVLQKNDAAILNIIAANKWKRPIYFTSERTGLGFEKYLRQDGMAYRLVPVEGGEVNRSWVFDKMTNKFRFGNCNTPGVYFDEENRRHLNSIRLAYASAASNLAANNRKEDARKLLKKCDEGMLAENFGYGMVSRFQQHNYISLQFYEACLKAGDTALAKKVSASLKKDLNQQMEYYAKLGNMSRQELENSTSQSVRFRYQHERDNFLSGISQKLMPLYEDAERGFQFLRAIEDMDRQYATIQPGSPEMPSPIKTSGNSGGN